MRNIEQRIAELHYELGMLQAALEFMSDPTDRYRILSRASACVAEYTQLVDARLSTILSVDEPLTARQLGEAEH
jgi:hypothetical protein